jgi:hypothetical protein
MHRALSTIPAGRVVSLATASTGTTPPCCMESDHIALIGVARLEDYANPQSIRCRAGNDIRIIQTD